MPILKLPFFIIPKDQRQPWSYTPLAPTTRRTSILGPLRRRQYQTRQQQIRYGTYTRVGASPYQRDEHPSTGQYISCEAHLYSDQQVQSTPGGNHGSGSPFGSGSASLQSSQPPSPTLSCTSTFSSTTLMDLPPRLPSPALSVASTITVTSTTNSFPFPPPHSAPGRPVSNLHAQQLQHSHLHSQSTTQQSSSLGRSVRPSTVTKGIRMVGQAMGFGTTVSSSSSTSSNCGAPPSSSASCTSSLAPSSPTSPSSCEPSLGLRRMSSPSLSSVYKMDGIRLSTSSKKVYISSSPSNKNSSNSNSPPSEYGHVSSVHVAELASNRLPLIMKEYEYSLEDFDKVFALAWLTDEDILLGTKCNNVMLLNVRTNRRIQFAQLADSLTWTYEDVQSHLKGLGSRDGVKRGVAAAAATGARGSRTNSIPHAGLSLFPAYASILSRVSPSSGFNTAATTNLERVVSSNLSALRMFNLGRRSSTPSGLLGSNDLASNLSSLAIHSSNSHNHVVMSNTTTTRHQGQTLDPYMHQVLNPLSAGIRSIIISPNREMVAIGAGEPNNVTIYSLPEFEPIGMMHGHTDLVFSLRWISDTVLVSASRDGTLRVWSLVSEPLTQLPTVTRSVNVWKDILIREEERVKVRDLAYNRRSGQLMTLNTDGYVKLWDRESYQRVSKIKLLHYSEAVCLTANSYVNLYAVGSQAHISILDPRTSSTVHAIDSCDEGWGVRSLNFKSHIVTTGGGYGRLGFYDLRAQKYIEGFDDGANDKRYREIGNGWLSRESAIASDIAGLPIRNAVYAMEYDDTGTRLFAAGGPLQLGLCGSYAAVWS